jgi:hypothetical protein
MMCDSKLYMLEVTADSITYIFNSILVIELLN